MSFRKPIRINWHNFFPSFTEEDCRNMILYGLHDDSISICRQSRYPDHQLLRATTAAKGNYLKVGYYTENLPPDLENFEWFFWMSVQRCDQPSRYCKRGLWRYPSATRKLSFDRSSLREKDRFCLFYIRRAPHRKPSLSNCVAGNMACSVEIDAQHRRTGTSTRVTATGTPAS